MDKLKASIRGAFKSFTMWFNAIMATAIAALPSLHDALPSLQQYIDPAFYKHLFVVTIVGNILLRVKTNKALHDK